MSEQTAADYVNEAEEKAVHVDDLPEDTTTREVHSVAVIGAGTMGGGIAMVFSNAGLPVTLIEQAQEGLDRGIATIKGNYDRTAAKGRISEQDVADRMERITPTLNLEDAADADLIIEAVFEEMDVQEGRLHPARCDRQGRRDPGHEHLPPRRRRDRRGDESPAGRRRPALLQSGQRHEAAGGRAWGADRPRRDRHKHAARPEGRQEACARAYLRRLHRQPDDDAVPPGG